MELSHVVELTPRGQLGQISRAKALGSGQAVDKQASTSCLHNHNPPPPKEILSSESEGISGHCSRPIFPWQGSQPSTNPSMAPMEWPISVTGRCPTVCLAQVEPRAFRCPMTNNGQGWGDAFQNACLREANGKGAWNSSADPCQSALAENQHPNSEVYHQP